MDLQTELEMVSHKQFLADADFSVFIQMFPHNY